MYRGSALNNIPVERSMACMAKFWCSHKQSAASTSLHNIPNHSTRHGMSVRPSHFSQCLVQNPASYARAMSNTQVGCSRKRRRIPPSS
mmetsp:Transcript_74865/g.124836  ORF Transcript_74865/g.124836 Transcript_74865/m.124836 type:complete len:88 (+) Transcript_74865:93-356(+)